MKFLISILLSIVSLSLFAKIDYYSSFSGKGKINNVIQYYYGLQLGPLSKAEAYKFIGKEYTLLQRYGKQSTVKISNVGVRKFYDDAYPDGLNVYSPFIEKDGHGLYPFLAVNKKHKIKDYYASKKNRLSNEELLKYEKTIMNYIKENKNLPLWAKGVSKYSEFEGHISENKKWVQISGPSGSFLLFENKVIFSNTRIGSYGSNTLSFLGSVVIDDKKYLLIDTTVNGPGTDDDSLGLFLFENNKVIKYVPPFFKPEEIGGGV